MSKLTAEDCLNWFSLNPPKLAVSLFYVASYRFLTKILDLYNI